LAFFSIGCIEAVGDKGLCNIPAMTIGVSRAQYDLYSGPRILATEHEGVDHKFHVEGRSFLPTLLHSKHSRGNWKLEPHVTPFLAAAILGKRTAKIISRVWI
jgi:hypothetical protein